MPYFLSVMAPTPSPLSLFLSLYNTHNLYLSVSVFTSKTLGLLNQCLFSFLPFLFLSICLENKVWLTLTKKGLLYCFCLNYDWNFSSKPWQTLGYVCFMELRVWNECSLLIPSILMFGLCMCFIYVSVYFYLFQYEKQNMILYRDIGKWYMIQVSSW